MFLALFLQGGLHLFLYSSLLLLLKNSKSLFFYIWQHRWNFLETSKRVLSDTRPCFGYSEIFIQAGLIENECGSQSTGMPSNHAINFFLLLPCCA